MGARRYTEQDIQRKFLANILVGDGCWLWAGNLVKGYGRLTGNVKAYRYSYELFAGPIPDGLTIDHLCRTPACVRPDHLEPVTIQENIRRSYCVSAINARKTHCKRGHEFTPANTRIVPGGAGRECRTCRNVWQMQPERKEYRRRWRAAHPRVKTEAEMQRDRERALRNYYKKKERAVAT